MSYTFPSYHEWEAGKIYTYSIKIKGAYNGEVNKDDVPIDVEYWSQFGKTDDIVIRDVDYTDFENMFFISTNHTEFGYDCYQNEGKPFGLFYTHAGSEPFEGKVRFVFMRGSQIVEKFQPIDIKDSGRLGRKKDPVLRDGRTGYIPACTACSSEKVNLPGSRRSGMSRMAQMRNGCTR